MAKRKLRQCTTRNQDYLPKKITLQVLREICMVLLNQEIPHL